MYDERKDRERMHGAVTQWMELTGTSPGQQVQHLAGERAGSSVSTTIGMPSLRVLSSPSQRRRRGTRPTQRGQADAELFASPTGMVYSSPHASGRTPPYGLEQRWNAVSSDATYVDAQFQVGAKVRDERLQQFPRVNSPLRGSQAQSQKVKQIGGQNKARRQSLLGIAEPAHTADGHSNVEQDEANGKTELHVQLLMEEIYSLEQKLDQWELRYAILVSHADASWIIQFLQPKHYFYTGGGTDRVIALLSQGQ
jgi:hypothetical protein